MEKDEKMYLLIELRKEEGLNRKEFAKKYDIPYPTITDWEMGNRRIPEYFLRLLDYKIKSECNTAKNSSSQDDTDISGNSRLLISELKNKRITEKIIDRALFEGLKDTGEIVDCIIVLGDLNSVQALVSTAVKEYMNGRCSRLLLSSGCAHEFTEGTMSEAEHMYNIALKLGITKDNIIIENDSLNTIENILFSLTKLQRTCGLNNIKKILLITTTYHMRRSLAIANYLFPEQIKIIPHTANDNITKRTNWMKSKTGIENVKKELDAIISSVNDGIFPDFYI